MSNEFADSDYLSTVAADWAKRGASPAQSIQGPDLDQDVNYGCIGRYVLKYKLGEGALGAVYAAQDPLLSRLIAIKTLNLDVDESRREEVNSIFLNEARSAAGLSHPHIVTVFDAGMSDQKAYIAMELLKGQDLGQLCREGWQPTPAQSALILRRVADALAYAHSKGVVHCDVKPANIFMVNQTQPRVLDFGIARAAHSQNLISTNVVTGGSPFYMAPEQFRQAGVDRRTDVYALGVVLYELLTNQKPFHGSNLEDLSSAVLEQTPVSAHALNPSIPKALSDIAMMAMQKDPAHRYSSARDMSRALRRWLEHENHGLNLAELFIPRITKKRKTIFFGSLALPLIGVVFWLFQRGSPEIKDPIISSGSPNFASQPPLQLSDSDAGHASTSPQSISPEVIPLEEFVPMLESAASSKVPVIEPLLLSLGVPLIEPLKLPRPPPSFLRVAQLGKLEELSLSSDLTQQKNSGSQRPEPAEPHHNEPLIQPTARSVSEPKAASATKLSKDARPSSTANITAKPTVSAPAATIVMGTLCIAVAPWGQVEINGHLVGITPPLNELNLPEGKHQVIIRNSDFAPFSTSVKIIGGQSTLIKHSFGP